MRDVHTTLTILAVGNMVQLVDLKQDGTMFYKCMLKQLVELIGTILLAI